MKTLIVTIVAVILAGIAVAQPAPLRNETAPKAEDDFQLVKVADGVYAATAKSGGWHQAMPALLSAMAAC